MKLSMLLVLVAMTFSSCNCFKKMARNQDDVKLTCTPEVLILNNGIVAADINVTFPAKYFNKKAVLKVTPVLVFEGGEVAAPTLYLQGSKVKDNYTVVAADHAGSYSQHIEFPYDPRMDQCELQLRSEIKCPKSNKFVLLNLNNGAIPTKAEAAVLAGTDEAAKTALVKKFGMTITCDLNTLQKDINYSEMMKPMDNNYKKVTTVVSKADILYAINSSKVTGKAEKNADLADFKTNVNETKKNDHASQNIAVKGYASPDGPEGFNDKLSKARSETGKTTISQLLKEAGLDVDAAAYGEDWDGFKEMVEKSEIKDKALILQVLSLYNSSTQRESEIKNMSSVFGELKSDILPKLRRAQVVNTTDIQGKTDEELVQCIMKGEKLTADEYLYVAQTQAETPEEKATILGVAAKEYASDARIQNNLGVAQAQMGDEKAALASIERAAKLDASSELNNNLVMANLANGNVAEAKKYAKAGDSQTKTAIAAAEGDYKTAAKGMKGYNAAIAETMNNNYAGAKKAIANDTSAEADYLRSVIASKEGDVKTAEAQLKSAIKKNPKLAVKAAKDVNLKVIKAPVAQVKAQATKAELKQAKKDAKAKAKQAEKDAKAKAKNAIDKL
ncbi:MAG: hypothetical protein RR298_02685 [Alistipes sp.]